MLSPCPHCGSPLDFGPHDAGQIVQCPHCGNQMIGPQVPTQIANVMPGYLHTPQAYIAPQMPTEFVAQPAPQIHATQIHVHPSPSPRPQKRLGAFGWFTRAFAATSGYMLAVCFFTLIPVVLAILFCAGIIGLAAKELEKAQRAAAKASYSRHDYEPEQVSLEPMPISRREPDAWVAPVSDEPQVAPQINDVPSAVEYPDKPQENYSQKRSEAAKMNLANAKSRKWFYDGMEFFARIKSLGPEMITLVKENGDEVKIERARLTDEENEFVAEWKRGLR